VAVARETVRVPVWPDARSTLPVPVKAPLTVPKPPTRLSVTPPVAVFSSVTVWLCTSPTWAGAKMTRAGALTVAGA
jgi:hypothetical protein